MKAECTATIFFVTDVERSLEYYTSVLGFRVDFRYNDLAGLEYDTVLIYLSGPAQDVRKAVGEGSVYIFCDEVDHYCTDVSAKGASITVPIADRAYGMRDFAIEDPDGNMLSFGWAI